MASAADFLEWLALNTPPSVLVSDIGMPEEDGVELIEKLRALDAEKGGGIPAVALTAYAGPEDRGRVLSAGYQVHLPKPVEPDRLASVIAQLTSPELKSFQTGGGAHASGK
jgi:CheY-like chemotaxis protein